MATYARLLLGIFAAMMLAGPAVCHGQEDSGDRGRRGGWRGSEEDGRDWRRDRERGRDRRREDRDGEERGEKPAPVVEQRSLSPQNESMGFGKPKAAPAARSFGSSQPASAAGSNAGSATNDKDREYARGLLSKYDTNGNRVLDEDEWRQIRGDPEKADTNRDKRITFDELVARVTSMRREKEATRTSAGGGDLRSYRLASATEKLPEGLPSWFSQRDRDGDGQVAMHEWSRSWNSSTVRDFTSKDSNGDGIITAAEALDSAR